MPTISANGLTVAYEVAGEGPPLILLHGATGSGRSHFFGLLPVLATTFRAYAPDARGHAGTRWDPGDGFSTADLVADVVAFADAQGLQTFHLLGYSMGGMTALAFAVDHGPRLRSLVALSVAAEREPRLRVASSLMDPARIERQDPAWAAALASRHDPVQGEGAWRRLLSAVVADIASQPLLTPAELRAIEVPTLVVAGDRDPFVPVGRAWQLARQVADGRLLIIPGADHDLLGSGHRLLLPALIDQYATIDLGTAAEDLP